MAKGSWRHPIGGHTAKMPTLRRVLSYQRGLKPIHRRLLSLSLPFPSSVFLHRRSSRRDETVALFQFTKKGYLRFPEIGKEIMRLSSWLIVLISLHFLNGVLADQIFTPQAGGTFGRSSHEPKYNIEFHQADSPYHPNDDQESLVMSNQEGRNYMCFLPSVDKPKAENSVAQRNSSNSIVESERSVRLKTPDELLEDLKGPCFVRQEGWWTYEFCYHKKLRQIHLEGEKALQEFVLGEYDAEATALYNQNLSDFSTLKDPRSKDASQRYHTHIYTNGTTCDLTNQPRETEVRFVCQPGPKGVITSIAELSTCKYALTFQTPYLCKHPMFKQERPIRHTIYCNELPKVVGSEDQNPQREREDSISSSPTSFEDNKKIKTVEGMTAELSNYEEDVDSEQFTAT